MSEYIGPEYIRELQAENARLSALVGKMREDTTPALARLGWAIQFQNCPNCEFDLKHYAISPYEFALHRKRTADKIRALRRDFKVLNGLFDKQCELLRLSVNTRKALEQENKALRKDG